MKKWKKGDSMNDDGQFPVVRDEPKSKGYAYRPWKGAVLWFGTTGAGVLACGFGPNAAMVCALGFVAALVWSVIDR